MTNRDLVFMCFDEYRESRVGTGELNFEQIAARCDCSVAAIHSYYCIYQKNNHQEITNIVSNQQAADTKQRLDINKRFMYMERLIKMVMTGHQPSLIITGEAGIGKTYTIMKMLKECGLESDYYTFVKGYTTNKGLFQILQINCDGLIIFDDCDSIFKDKVGSNILKTATDSYSIRQITWGKNKLEHENPDENTFEFNGQIIFISNLSVNEFPQSLQSRSTVINLEMTITEKLLRIDTILGDIDAGESVEYQHKSKALDFMIQNQESIKDINIRTLLKLSRIYAYHGEFEDIDEMLMFLV